MRQLANAKGAIAAAALLPLLALARVPEANAANAPRSGTDPHAAFTPQERALSGGVIALRSPGSRMVKLVASTFKMGSEMDDVLDAVAECAREPLGHRCKEEMFSDELPARKVALSAYWIDRTEVSVRDYRRCVALGRCRPIPFAQGARRFDRPELPASLVRWADARAYCRFRGARLPTEAEFERAARGTVKRRYPWGNLYNSRAANHGRLGLDTTDPRDGFAELAPIASFPQGRTREGLLDLAGNVAEWVFDVYAPGYPETAETNPTGPAVGAAQASGHVVRGGHFGSAPSWLRGAARGSADADTRSPTIGFRCARSDQGAKREAPDDSE